MSQLDTPANSSDATSFYDDALGARRGANFEPPIFLFLWSIFLVIDSNDRLVSLFSWTRRTTVVPWGVELSACILQFIIAICAICLCLASVMCSARVLYYITRAQCFIFVLSVYIVLVYAISIPISYTEPAKSTAVTEIFARLSTAVCRFQLLILPLLVTGRFARVTSVRLRAMFTSIPPVVSGGSILTVSLYTMFSVPPRSARIVFEYPTAAGSFPLLTFFAGTLLCFWAISGLFIICSQTACAAVKAYVYSSVFIFAVSVANFSVVQPVLAVSKSFSDLSAGFLGTSSSCALIPLLFACILPSPFLLAVHWEQERTKSQLRVRRSKGFKGKGKTKRGKKNNNWKKSLAKLQELLPKRPKLIAPQGSTPTAISVRSASLVTSQSTVARYIYNADDEVVEEENDTEGIAIDIDMDESMGEICVPSGAAHRIYDAHEDEGFGAPYDEGEEYASYRAENV